MKRSASIFPLILSAVFIIGMYLGTFINSQPQTSPEATASARIQEFQAGEYLVTRVLDGDTIELKNGIRIRYYGIDAPELRDRWGETAASYNRSLVLDKRVRVEPSRARDPYGRIVADVWVGDAFTTEALLKEGYARVKIIKGEAKSASLPRLVAAEEEAKESHRGLWAAEWFMEEGK